MPQELPVGSALRPALEHAEFLVLGGKCERQVLRIARQRVAFVHHLRHDFALLRHVTLERNAPILKLVHLSLIHI